ncbi:MAG TPA: hypothetical protein PKX38_07735, partial [Alphaproteobacteria bacterium]|nr:hypothetical protein [Alphaproteobacteria bacterium]
IIGGNLFGPSHISWAVSLAFENIVMVNAALFFSMILSSAATAATATAGFYILARLMGQLLGIIDSTGKGTVIYNLMEYILQAISAVMPRLDLMAQTSWLIYGQSVEISSILLQAAIFTILIITAALIDLVRRQF